MTSLVNDATREVIGGGDLSGLTTRFGLIVVVLTALLLTARTLLRAYAGDADAPGARRLSFAAMPLVLMTIAIIGARLVSLAT